MKELSVQQTVLVSGGMAETLAIVYVFGLFIQYWKNKNNQTNESN
ncbi:MAG: hypothetical protein ACJAZB_001437 [Psychrosphaera sp.]|jgi:hypothetical protein